jgi:hypothetical protein
MKRAILAEKKFSWKVPVAVSSYHEFSSDLFYFYPSVVCMGSFFSGSVSGRKKERQTKCVRE